MNGHSLRSLAAIRTSRPRPAPMLVMNGTADALIPYEGGRGTSRYAVDRFWSAEKTIAYWRKLNACEDGDAASDLGVLQAVSISCHARHAVARGQMAR
jgi:polyhydroxybutyrate depolymerase